VAQLCQHLPEFEALNTRIILISFGRPDQARVWLEETCWPAPVEINAPFTLLLDPERRAYRAYELEYSLLRSWALKVWRRYAQLLFQGRKWRGTLRGAIAGNWAEISSWIQLVAFVWPFVAMIPLTVPMSNRYWLLCVEDRPLSV
jgi:hypothetical protein